MKVLLAPITISDDFTGAHSVIAVPDPDLKGWVASADEWFLRVDGRTGRTLCDTVHAYALQWVAPVTEPVVFEMREGDFWKQIDRAFSDNVHIIIKIDTAHAYFEVPDGYFASAEVPLRYWALKE